MRLLVRLTPSNIFFRRLFRSLRMESDSEDDMLYYSHQKLSSLIREKGNKNAAIKEYLENLNYQPIKDFNQGNCDFLCFFVACHNLTFLFGFSQVWSGSMFLSRCRSPNTWRGKSSFWIFLLTVALTACISSLICGRSKRSFRLRMA